MTSDDVSDALVDRAGITDVESHSRTPDLSGDGSSIGAPLPGALLPDWLRVDERGWIYLAEESGHLLAFAPQPHLSLVR